MDLRYFAITNEKHIVWYRSFTKRSFEDVVLKYLLCNPPDQDIYYSEGDFSLHCLTVSGLSFIAVTDRNASRQKFRNLVVEVSRNFLSDGTRFQRAKSGGKDCLQQSYSLNLEELMESPNSSKGNGSLDQLRSNVNTVTAVMQENTRLALQRGDRLNNLVSKTDELAASANQFQTTATKVARKTWWENFRMKLIIVGVVGGILLVIVIIILWQTGVFNSKSQHQ
ncbi:synaptobrevin, putative [Schistosoma mansoni]|uniref:Vesicle-associated membrane protein 7 n=1 Tax=Schistosoma mansoni TaxID=6183 RepID=Q26586_SCHMA|nr:synaptobrevin, putative [Schistosoma mansoni]CAA54425.1 IMP25 [Schistosoma mansoni]|eukprot:XP_018644256.1 synaptobrevin, putative [Schistosoma mansoni]